MTYRISMAQSLSYLHKFLQKLQDHGEENTTYHVPLMLYFRENCIAPLTSDSSEAPTYKLKTKH